MYCASIMISCQFADGARGCYFYGNVFDGVFESYSVRLE